MGRWPKTVFLGTLATAAGLCVLAGLDSRETASRQRDLHRDTQIVARQFTGRLQSGLEQHLIGLQQMANFWENSEEVTEQEFHQFASATLQLTPLCLRISAVDPSLRVRWVYPPEPNRPLVGFDVRNHPQGYETIRRAMDTKEPVLSPPLQLVGGSHGFILAAPVFRNDGFLGEVVCALRGQDFFSSLILPDVLERYAEVVLDSGTLLFSSSSAGSAGPGHPAAAERFSLGGRTWEVRVNPREEVVLSRLRSGQAAFWTLGSLLALVAGAFAGGAIYWASEITSRIKSQKAALSATRERLDGAMGQLLQAEKMTALGELVAGVAHEVNNPLASIMGFTQLALTHDLPPTVRRYLETASSETERAGKIVRNLLTFARKQPPEKKQLGLNGVIEKTLELKAYHFRTSQIQVEKDLAPDLPVTLLDFHQIQQVFLNLLNNAEQAMLEAGRGGTIRIVTRRAGERIEVRVSDDGPGIPEEVQNRIFEPFFTTKKEGDGTGLGLSLCYGIVQEHGGHIRVVSQPGCGATFVVNLPILQEPAPESAAPPVAPPPAASGLRILVVDDELSVQSFLVALLSAGGHSVDTASDSPEALRKIASNGHDLIITDMKMPHGTGKDIYEAVVSKSPELARRVIFTTGDGASAETQQFIRETGNPILLKPCTLEQIERAIARVTGN